MNGSNVRQQHKRAMKEARRESNGEKKRPGKSIAKGGSHSVSGVSKQASERYKRAGNKARGK